MEHTDSHLETLINYKTALFVDLTSAKEELDFYNYQTEYSRRMASLVEDKLRTLDRLINSVDAQITEYRNQTI